MKNEETVHDYVVSICDQCIRLEGKACNNPRCRFYLWIMAEIGNYLDALLIRPIVDGKRFDVEYAASMRVENSAAYALGQQSQKESAARFLEDEAAKLRGTSKLINQVDAHVVSILLTMAAAIRDQEVKP